MYNRLIQRNLMRINCWLGVIGIGLAVIHLLLSWQVSSQPDQIALNSLYWLAIIAVSKRRIRTSPLESSWLASSLGTLLIALILCKSVYLSAGDSSFVRLLPGFIVLGVALLASGFKFSAYWREGVLAAVLMIPPVASNYVLKRFWGYNLQIVIAKISAFLMHYVGFEVQRQDITIGLPHGAVSVAYECTGGDILILLWQLCIPAIFLLPMSRLQKIIMPMWTVALILALGSLRVTIMAIVVNKSALFEYWHGPAGNQIFSTLGICIFGSICCWLIESHLATDDATA
jgi:cyanoexosortase A